MSLPDYPKLLPNTIAYNGDKAQIPLLGELGEFCYAQGFPAITQAPLAAGGVAPRRIDFNGIFNELSQHTFYQQSGGQYSWSDTLDYPLNALVHGSDNIFYKCIKANGPDTSDGIKNPINTTGFWKTLEVKVPVGTTSVKGIVQLSTSITSTSTATAATSSAVKIAYDEARKATGKAYITATWASSGKSSWYRKWSDGFIEQGGNITLSTGTTWRNVATTFQLSFTTTLYTISFSKASNGGVEAHGGTVSIKTKTGFTASYWVGSTASTIKPTWYACGY